MSANERIVAVVLNDDGTYHDGCYTWETGQNFALANGMRVIAVCDDGNVTREKAQALYDAERERYRDCFGASDFRLDIELGNEEMQSRLHVAGALREVADALQGSGDEGTLRDTNGNTTGRWQFS